MKVLLLLAIWLYVCAAPVASTKKFTRQQLTHYQLKHKYYKYLQKYTQNGWPKIKGRCDVPKRWNGFANQPILDAALAGNMTVLFLIKRTCVFCMEQLEYLNRMAVYFRYIGNNMTFIVLNHRRQPLARSLINRYPALNFYEEPANENIFGALKAGWRQVLTFDRCGRQQYHFGYPYTSQTFHFVRLAILNTRDHYEQLCGKCSQLESTPTPAATTTQQKITDIDGPST